MSFFDQVYDEMSWQEICYRLPSELAVSAIVRRITNLETLRMFFDNIGSQPASVRNLKEHVNDVVAEAELDDIFEEFDTGYHPTLFNWLTQINIDRLKEHDPDKLSTKFLFNITDADDSQGLQSIFGRVLEETTPSQSHIRAILRKADDVCLAPLLDTLLKDSRPEVRACILCVPGLTNKKLVSDHQLVIGLKAFAKCAEAHPIKAVNVLNIKAFNNLRPFERLTALERYLGYFPHYKRVQAFDPVPTEEEFKVILFAGCIEYNDLVVKIDEMYKKITQMDPPHDKDDEEE
ncbi:hypothetical protein LCGC14_2512230 [marine sediment metagenome]|uniref:Uncharacterized protein n=1 Tax=marine sediment metagenome TaxID=412755 RepID=A0A0F9DAL8_9ZZZZ